MAGNSTLARSYGRKARNRHHLFYPSRVWNATGLNARRARNNSIIMIEQGLHTDLHRDINGKIGKHITRDMLPDKRTIRYIKDRCRRHRKQIREMGAIEKTKWFIEGLNPEIERNAWTIMMLKVQLEFLEEHAEEI